MLIYKTRSVVTSTCRVARQLRSGFESKSNCNDLAALEEDVWPHSTSCSGHSTLCVQYGTSTVSYSYH